MDHPNGDIEILEKIALLGGSIPDRFDNHAVIMVNGRSLAYPDLISKRVKDGDPVHVSFERYYTPHSLYGGMFSYVIRNDDSVSFHVGGFRFWMSFHGESSVGMTGEATRMKSAPFGDVL